MENASPVTVSFGEPVETPFVDVRVIDAGGRLVSGPAVQDPDDAAVYTVPILRAPAGPASVQWRALSRDGDIIRHSGQGLALGEVDAGIRGQATFRPWVVLGRLLLVASLAVLLGLAVVRLWIAAGVEAGLLHHGGWWRAWRRAAAAGAAGLVISPLAHLHGLGVGMGEMATLLGDTRWGRAWIVQAVALVVGVAAARVLRREDRPGGVAAALLVAAPATALVAVAWAGHASGANDRAIGIGADVLHGWATAAWLGGLVGLMVLVAPALRRLPDDARTKLGAHVVVRFSTMALVAVAVLAVTGVYRALAELPSLDALIDTAYGGVLSVKLGIFALMLVAGAYNRFVIHPRLERAAMGLEESDRGAALLLRRSVGAELVLAGCIMVAVAVMVSLPTPV